MSKFEIRLAMPENAEELLEYLRIVGGESDNLSFGAEGIGSRLTEKLIAFAGNHGIELIDLQILDLR